ncbi:MAG: conserved protein of unknown function [Nitrospira sp.]
MPLIKALSTTAVTDMKAAVLARANPSIVTWERTEGRPRNRTSFDRALRAEIHDALWMLSRQWQMGEFKGEDAGSPALAKIHLESARPHKYKPDGHAVEPFDETIPLETQVEQLPIAFRQGDQKVALDLRLVMGRYWLKLLAAAGVGAGVRADFLTRFPIARPNPDAAADAAVCAHREAWQQFAAVSGGRALDGYEFYSFLQESNFAPNWTSITAGPAAPLNTAMTAFRAWYERQFYQPEDPQQKAWRSDYLEYQFACAAPKSDGEEVLVADEYYHGHLDWYNFDFDKSQRTLGEPAETPPAVVTFTRTFWPTNIIFNGMPLTRWWAFEDGKTNFGAIKPGTTDLAKLLVMEFGLAYANDWFLTPFRLPAGSLSRVKGLAVTNVFGERFWIDPAGQGLDDQWSTWRMFSLNVKGNEPAAADLALLLPASTAKIQDGPAREEVAVMRDEMANMVWGIEKTITLPHGRPKPGFEAASETRNVFERLAAVSPTPEPEYRANIRYSVMNYVPENWIPFIPVHDPGSNREIRLQRAAMLRFLKGDDHQARIRPRTELLREGLDAKPKRTPYFIHEEEVPRAGILVTQSFQRTRWYGGRAFQWLGVRKTTGRGEGSSGLAFDQIIDVPEKPK